MRLRDDPVYQGIRAGLCTGPGPCDPAPLGLGKNWVTDVGGLPLYIRAIAHSIRRGGASESAAIATAIATVKRWAAGGGKVTPATRARAAKALAEWEAKKAASHARGITPEGQRDIRAVTEAGSSASALLPLAQPRPPKPRQAKLIGGQVSHAFRGNLLTRCTRAGCGKPATDTIHRQGAMRPKVRAAPGAPVEEAASGKRHRGPGHLHVPTGHVAGNLHRQRMAQKQTFNANADELEPKMAEAMRRVFTRQARETVAKMQASGSRAQEPNQPPPQQPPNAGQLFDTAYWADQTAQAAQAVYQAAGTLSRDRIFGQLGSPDGLDERSSLASVTDTLTNRAKRMGTDVSQTTHKEIQDQLAQGVANGESMGKLSKRVRSVFARASKFRADTIARTEVVGALNEAANTYAQNLPSGVVSRKQWMSHHDERTRPTHRRADGQKQPVGLPFHVGASLLNHPGDPTGPPNETINCRCSVAYLPAVAGLSLKEAA